MTKGQIAAKVKEEIALSEIALKDAKDQVSFVQGMRYVLMGLLPALEGPDIDPPVVDPPEGQ